MKTIKSLVLSALSLLALFLLFACSGKDDNSNQSGETPNVITTNDDSGLRDSLDMAQEYMNTLSSLVNEVTDGMSEIKRMEHIVSTTDLSHETPDKRSQIRNDILLIKNAIRDRQNKIAELEEKLIRAEALNSFNEDNRNSMLQTISNLKLQLQEQQALINDLTAQLESANNKIKSLTGQVDSLELVNENTRTDATEQDRKHKEQLDKLTNELNECYYAIGTKKELKDHKIIDSGFFKKTKILQNSNIIHSYFTKGDKRTLNEIPLHSKKAKVLTNHDKLSYSIEDVNGMKVIKIHDQALFWEYSNYLVVQID